MVGLNGRRYVPACYSSGTYGLPAEIKDGCHREFRMFPQHSTRLGVQQIGVSSRYAVWMGVNSAAQASRQRAS